MYSDSNVFQEFQNQTRGLIPDMGNKAHQDTSSSFHSQNYLQSTRSSQPKGANSLSMRMLNKGIEEVQGTSSKIKLFFFKFKNKQEKLNLCLIDQPPSIFDLKRGDNPTGATVPRGFKSVQAPVALPPEQRRAPTRVEYQVNHVKQNWIEPK